MSAAPTLASQLAAAAKEAAVVVEVEQPKKVSARQDAKFRAGLESSHVNTVRVDGLVRTLAYTLKQSQGLW
jgi:hypothetical protein